MRATDPFEGVDVRARTAVLATISIALLLVAYIVIFPTQTALAGMVFAFVFMIMFHEFGHFTMAKRAGMKVTEFFVGFGPRLWSTRKGETEYGVKAIPLGGYCKVIGMTNLEDIDPDDEPRTYRAKSWHDKVLMCVAGPATHFIIAFVLMFSILFFAGDYRNQHATTTLGAVTNGAKDAGLRAGDKVLSIDNTKVTNWNQVPALVRGPADHPRAAGADVPIVVERHGVRMPVTVKLQQVNDAGQARVVAGISTRIEVAHPGFIAAVGKAPVEVGQYTWDAAKAVGSMFSPSGISNYFKILSGDKSKTVDQTKRFVSPVGFGQLANDAVKAGWVEAFGLLLMINIFVGLLNLLPLLPFDGGHIAVASYERVMSSLRHRRVQVDITKLMPVTVVVVAILGFIFVSSVFLDVTNPVHL